ncbi:MAG TPA: DUF1707 domain-containing protein [Gemmatimonadales bacterium]|jgi:hypothetical protein
MVNPGRLTPQVSPAARDRAAELLAQRYAADEITQADLEQRLELVYAAATPADLDAVVADLAGPEARSAARVSTIRSLFSGQERRITGQVPADLRVVSRMGYVELDLRDATFAPGVTEIDVRSLMGYVQIRLPLGVRVESEGHAMFGFFAVKGAGMEDATAESTVRITGRAAFGFAEIIVGSGRSRRGRLTP